MKGSVVLIFVVAVLIGAGLFVFGSKSIKEEGLPDDVTGGSVDYSIGGGPYGSERISRLKQYRAGLERYFAENDKYPITSAGELVEITSTSSVCDELLLGGYVSDCSPDPSGDARYMYKSDGDTFTLEAVLGDAASPPCENGDGCLRNAAEIEGDFVSPALE